LTPYLIGAGPIRHHIKVTSSIVDQHPDPDSTYFPDADPDSTDADTDLIFIEGDADPDPDPIFI
jgi:hypothetical protein